MRSLPCPPQYWPRFSALLDTALDLDEAARMPWLQELNAGDAALRPWLARVLSGATGPETGDFLANPFLPLGAEPEIGAGSMIGPYRLESRIGAGGMGEVWRASRQDEGPHRAVALKLPHPEMLGGPFRQRFRRERDMLAGLSHPHIAALYDAGVSESGHPYLALELVAGESVTAWCAASGATLEQRVSLIGQMLSALAYAHARLIVHRDIKPSNVMVTADGTVKLLDFGIAKLLDPGGGRDGLTGPVARLATAGYGAPEQRDLGAVTVATDLFSAGVLLFELCTGQRPWRPHAGESEAPLASSRADAAAACIADGRLPARLRGDLDAIIAKALSIDPAERYATADAFARDLRRWREGLPVSARRIGRIARAAKFVRRNRLATSLAATLALALAGGTAGIAWQAHRAQREADHANAIKDFLIGLFEQEDPRGGKPTEAMSARALLDAGADRIDTLSGDRETRIDVLHTLGSIYDALDDQARAETVGARALDLSRSLYGPADQRVVDATLSLASSEVEFDDEEKAKALLEDLRAPLFARYPAGSLERARYLLAHARSLRVTHGGREQALAEDSAAVAIFASHYPDSPDYPEALQDLSGYQYDGERYAASLASLDQARALEQSHHEYDALDAMMYRAEAASRLQMLGRYAEADATYAANMDQGARLFGRQSVWYLHALIGRAQMEHLRGERLRADALYQDGMELARTGAGTYQATALRRSYGGALGREGRAAEAIPLLEAALAETRQNPRDEPNLRRTEALLGDAYDQVGRTLEARALLGAARDAWLHYGPALVQGLAARQRWGMFLLDHGDPQGAKAEFNAVLALSHGMPSAPAALASAALARIALASGDIPAALAASAAAMDTIGRVTLEYDVRAGATIQIDRATILHAAGQREPARALAAHALANCQLWDAPGSPRILKAQALLADIER